MRLLHHSKVQVDQIYPREQFAGADRFDKPNGFWVSVEGEDDWESWCRDNDFCLNRLTHTHEVVLKPDANVLILSGEQDIRDFHAEYGKPLHPEVRGEGIDWPRVAEKYDGIIITPYVWSMRHDIVIFWYYTWDCASGCIWDPKCVESIKLLEVTG